MSPSSHTVLNLSNNRIKSISGLDGLRITSLNLSSNALTAITNMSKLPRLETLDVSGNSIKSLGGLQACTALASLFADDNHVESVHETELLPPALGSLSLMGCAD